MKEELTQLVEKKIIEKVTEPTDWVSSLVVVEKKNGKLRLCIDPKDLNKNLKRSHYPLPTFEEIVPELHNAKIFSTFDARSGFWQIKLTEESSYLTTFNTPFGRYRWLRLPFGISSASEEYQRRMADALAGLDGVKVFIDDILVYGSGENLQEAMIDHDKKVEQLFHRLRSLNIKLNSEKVQYKKR